MYQNRFTEPVAATLVLLALTARLSGGVDGIHIGASGELAACCYTNTIGQYVCENLTEADCEAQLPAHLPRLWQPGEQCGLAAQFCPHPGCLEATGSCYQNHATPGCEDTQCCDSVCTQDDFCCFVEWDSACSVFADALCPCGNGAPDPGETCDDGNTVSGDGCFACQVEISPEVCPVEFGTSFHFQGQLVLSGVPVNNSCEFQISLWDAEIGGDTVGPQQQVSTTVIGGRFVINLDFGPRAFDGGPRWLDVVVQCTGDAQPANLSPRTPVLPSPYSLVSSDSCASRNSWSVTGNVNTIPGVNFVGTLDAQPLELRGVGVGINRSNPTHPLHVGTGPSNGNGAHVTAGGVWTNGSDRATKTDFAPIDSRAILRKLAGLPVTSWRYQGEPEHIRHIGPMAQDFHSTFGLGEDGRYIGTLDADGVAFSAIQALHAELSAADHRIEELEGRVERLEAARGFSTLSLSGVPLAICFVAGCFHFIRVRREVQR